MKILAKSRRPTMLQGAYRAHMTNSCVTVSTVQLAAKVIWKLRGLFVLQC